MNMIELVLDSSRDQLLNQEPQPRVLVCSRTPIICQSLRNRGMLAEQAGYHSMLLPSLAEVDVVILDADVAEKPGERLRNALSAMAAPVIVIARSEADCLAAVRAGAADAILAPYRDSELAIRVGVVWARLRKGGDAAESFVECAGLRLRLDTRDAWLFGRSLELTETEFTILKCLARRAHQIVSRDELGAALYQRQVTPYERSIDVHVSHIRKKLREPGAPLIRTVRATGYMLVGRHRVN